MVLRAPVRRFAFLCLLSLVALPGCATLKHNRMEDAPAYFTQVTPTGIRYGHNWEDRPCFTIDLDSTAWKLEEATADRVVWSRGEQHFAIYLADDRKGKFAIAGMNGEQALAAFMGYELDFVKPRFDLQTTSAPRMAKDANGIWMQWGWEGRGGKRSTSSVDKPADQRHTIISLWIDPWVLSFDWATTDLSIALGPTPSMLDVIESLHFYPQCFAAMNPGETWGAQGSVAGPRKSDLKRIP